MIHNRYDYERRRGNRRYGERSMGWGDEEQTVSPRIAPPIYSWGRPVYDIPFCWNVEVLVRVTFLSVRVRHSFLLECCQITLTNFETYGRLGVSFTSSATGGPAVHPPSVGLDCLAASLVGGELQDLEPVFAPAGFFSDHRPQSLLLAFFHCGQFFNRCSPVWAL